MKHKFLTLFTLVGVISLSGCSESESVDPGTSPEELNQKALDRLEKNEGISYNMFDILSTRLPSDSLRDLRADASTQGDFIDVVARQTDDYFDEVVEMGVSEFNISSIPTPFSGEAEITLKNLASIETAPGAAPFDLVGEYSKILLANLEQKEKDGHKEWIEILSFGETAGSSAPSETLSLNFAKLKFLASVPHTIIMDLSLTDDQVLTHINDVLNANDIPPVAIGLLLPAVQKVREANATNDQPFKDAMNSWLDGPIAQSINGGLNRDIIRRVQATVYLASLHAILVDEYVGTTIDMASLSVLHARYRAAIIIGTKDAWAE